MRDKKFSRKDPDERKDVLMRSALRCLEAEGYAGLSVRKITKEANVSQGMINLHFGSMSSLITYTYEVLSKEFLQFIIGHLEACNGSAVEKLDIFFQLSFAEDVMTPELLKAWLVFWSLIPNSPEMAEAYTRHNQKIESVLNQLLIAVCEENELDADDTLLASQSLTALLDGLWVRECLERHPNASDKALRAARDWAKRFCGDSAHRQG
ncbi:MAG: TetR family transcriptional regulator C-terminal domain-containing protein [Marinomonas sp.]